MKPKDFVIKYHPYALQTEKQTGINAIAILAQAAVESAWGEVCPGNMFFGIKDTDGLNGNEQLLTTTEYLDNPDTKFPVVLKVVQIAARKWKYTVKDWFRKYNTPEESFTHHANFFIQNKRYAAALQVKRNPYLFIDAIAEAGYATSPDYATLLKKVARTIEAEIKLLPA